MTTKVLLTAEAHAWAGPTLSVGINTDVPCHAYLRWTTHEEWVHLRSKNVRGLDVMGNPKFCFVSWFEVEQLEPGDTLVHSFDFGPWTTGDCRWWHFRFEAAGAASPSNTPIWHECYLGNQSVISLGILGEAQVLQGVCNLTPGAHISLTFDLAVCAIIVAVT